MISTSAIQLKRQLQHFYTPLRFPGGKSSLSSFFGSLIETNGLSHVQYVEPYAGGAGAALTLLILGKVNSIVINDLDRAIYAFWKAVTEDSERFIQRIREVPITITEWYRQREVYRQKGADLFDLGFATFFLNRTNRSGILDGGVIGGVNQTGKWLIDARFNKESLIQKIELIARHKHQIDVLNEDGLEVIRRYADVPTVLFYIDPPYYFKGSLLYLNSYNHNDHARLADLLNSLPETRWILSYDNVPQVRELYNARAKKYEFSLYHHASASKAASEIMVLSDNLELPTPELVCDELFDK
jgi:DNA adenine methylase